MDNLTPATLREMGHVEHECVFDKEICCFRNVPEEGEPSGDPRIKPAYAQGQHGGADH
jgi:hypothetical protein